jgi:hypothetical protein
MDFRKSFSRPFKKLKHLTGSRRKAERGADITGERADPTGSFPRPEADVVVAEGGHDREGNGADVEGREAGQRDLGPDVGVLVESGPSREGNVDGKKIDQVDPPTPAPSNSSPDGM